MTNPDIPSPPNPDSDVSTITQPESSPPHVPTPPNPDVSRIIQPESSPPHVQIVPSPPKSDVSTFVQLESSPPQVPALPNSDVPAQVPTVPSTNITAAPIPEVSFLNSQTTFNLNFTQYPQTIPNSSFAPNFTPTFPLTDFNPNSQQSLTELMSETLYKWPDQDQDALRDQDLFDFSGLQDFSGMNTFNSNTSNFLDKNVRFVLQSLQHIQIITHIRSSPLWHRRMATISTTPLQISTHCPTSLLNRL